ncbi:hypothetical protein [Thiocapsa bogorovii]|uniref:hypothetical protein n=1 Tax=Thiocapsa bogorovii TaxID=521689 RepID=UPI001E47FB48|nr:hypothetical protein [Thiocapsa bogorovii]UHD14811.1 hypothetical protein LT988_16140 [Thiocapsa bogorovii]
MGCRQEPRNEGDDAGIDLVVFSVGALRFAVASERIRGIADLAETPDIRAPALADLLGLARGPDPASAHTDGTRERLLRFRHTSQGGASDGAQTTDVRIEEPVSLRRAPAEAIHPLPALMETLSALPCVRGLVALSATNASDLAILLDPLRLPRDPCTTPVGSCIAAPARMMRDRTEIDQRRQGP